MALDFQRPDPSSPAAVASAQFSVVRRGYREEEVRDFLRQVSVELARLLERERFLQSELTAVQARGPVDFSAIDEQTITELLGVEAARVLSSAREAAQAMRDRAAEAAEQIIRDASRDAARVVEEATLEASRRRSDVSTEAEQEIELAKQQGREMVAEVRAYRERVLADLARRTEDARRELERIVHERERLLSAFERARHAATDVMGDLTDSDEAIRGVGVVPPLVPPDAPPPPRSIGPSDTPIFDARHYEDELRAAHTTMAEDDAEGSGESAEPTPLTGEVASDSRADSIGNDGVLHEESSTTSDDSPIEPETPTVSTTITTSAPIAEVVSILDHRRRRATTSEPTMVESASANPDAHDVAPLHPVFERRDAEPPAAGSTTRQRSESPTESSPATPDGQDRRSSRVDDVFERLRSASTTRVAEQIKQELRHGEPRPVLDWFAQRKATLEQTNPKLIRLVKRYLADEENAALTHVAGRRTKLDVESMLGTEGEQLSRLLEALREPILMIAVEAARSLSAQRRADLRTKMGNGAVMNPVGNTIAVRLIKPLRERMTELVTGAKGDRDQLAAELRAFFVSWKTEQAEMLSSDIAHFAFARGVFLGCEAGSQVHWLLDTTGVACAECEDNTLAGTIPHGQVFPTGHLHPLAHAGCRCLVVPHDK